MMVYVNDERIKFENDCGISFPVIRKEYWEKDHERKQTIHQDVHAENQNTFEQVNVKGTTKTL